MKNDQRTNHLKAIAAGVAIAAGKRNGDEVLGMLEAPATITKEIYAGLQQQAEWMDRDRACGQDAVDGFDERQKLLDEIMEASPWTMHPDFGLVSKSLVAEYEAQLPPWAIGKAKGFDDIGAQLCTKDGRKMGNAIVVGTKTAINMDALVIITDAGNMLTLTERELRESFHEPVWLLDVDKHPGVQRHRNVQPYRKGDRIPLTFDEIFIHLATRDILAINLANDRPPPSLFAEPLDVSIEGGEGHSSLYIRGPGLVGSELTFNEAQAATATLIGNRLTIEDAQGFTFAIDLEDEHQNALRMA